MASTNDTPPTTDGKPPRAHWYIYVPWGEEKKVKELLERGWVIVGMDERYGTPLLRLEEKP